MSLSKEICVCRAGRSVKAALAVILAPAAFFGCIPIILYCNDHTNFDLSLVEYLSRSIMCVIPFVLLGGAKWLKFDAKAFGKTLLFCSPLLIVNLLIFILGFKQMAAQGSSDNMIVGLLYSLLITFLIGFNEEIIFRGLMNGGLMPGLGKWSAVKVPLQRKRKSPRPFGRVRELPAFSSQTKILPKGAAPARVSLFLSVRMMFFPRH